MLFFSLYLSSGQGSLFKLQYWIVGLQGLGCLNLFLGSVVL